MSQALREPLGSHLQTRSRPSLEEVAGAYVAAGATPAARKCRRIGVARFIGVFGDLTGWAAASVTARREVRTEVMSFSAHAVVRCPLPVDLGFVVASGCHWGIYIRCAYPAQAAEFDEQAASLGFCAKETGRMWSYLAKICIVTGTAPAELSAGHYQQARTALHDAVIDARGFRPQSLSTPLFGLDAVMFHRGQGPAPDIRRRWTGRPAPEVDGRTSPPVGRSW